MALLVLGDIGRSPRSLYHSLCAADAGADVTLVGYAQSELPATLRARAARIDVRALPALEVPGRRSWPRPAFLAFSAARAGAQSAAAVAALVGARPDVILVQVPPAVPALAAAATGARLTGARLVVDWHDLGWTHVALRLGAEHRAVPLVRRAEHALARRADAHLCVSHAMAAALARDAGVPLPAVLHDRPAGRFRPLDDAARAQERRRLATRLSCPELADPRVPFVVSATSWSPDEDFGLLAEALRALDARATTRNLVVLITGRGPGRAAFERRLEAAPLRHARVLCAWLSDDDYPRVLGAADAGLCLHTSSSGLDLPMKVQDMLGCALPVLAYDYGPCLREALPEGAFGHAFFRSASDLAAALDAVTPRQDARRPAANPAATWEDEWRRVAAPLVL